MHDRWHDPVWRAKWLPSIWTDVSRGLRLSSAMLACKLAVNKCSAFPVMAAKAVCQRYACTSVLDPCFGWGDRMAAAYACPQVRRFHGMDPRSAAQQGFREQHDLYNAVRQADGLPLVLGSFTHGCSEANACVWPNEKFDLAFTSPPFYKCEFYKDDNDAGQSTDVHSSFSAWMSGFLVPLLARMAGCLRPCGHLAMHMVDSKGRHICKRMLQEVRAHIPELRFCEKLGMQVRAQGWMRGSMYRTEAIWVWRRRRYRLSQPAAPRQTQRFAETLALLSEFVAEHGRVPTVKETYRGFALGEWCRARRRQHADGCLSKDREHCFDRVPGWSWQPPADNHKHMTEAHAAVRSKASASFQLHLQLLQELGGALPKTVQEHKGVKVGRWLDNRRQDARKNKLSTEHMAALDALYPQGWRK